MLRTIIQTFLACALTFLLCSAAIPTPRSVLPVIPSCSSCPVQSNTFGPKLCLGLFTETMACSFAGSSCTTFGTLTWTPYSVTLVAPTPQPVPLDGFESHFNGLFVTNTAFFDSGIGYINMGTGVTAGQPCAGGPLTLGAQLDTNHFGQLNNTTNPCAPVPSLPCTSDGVKSCNTAALKTWLCQ